MLKSSLLFRKIQTLMVNNSRTVRIKNNDAAEVDMFSYLKVLALNIS